MNPRPAPDRSLEARSQVWLAPAVVFVLGGLLGWFLLPGETEGGPRWALRFAGLLIALLLAALLGILGGLRRRVERLTEARTADLMEAFRRHQIQIENMPLGVIEWDQDFRIRTWNPAAERIFGYSAEEILGHRGDGFLRPGGAGAEDRADIQDALLLGGGGMRSTHENLTKQNLLIVCNWYNTPLQTPEGGLLGVTSMVEDVTERKRSEEALRMSQKLESLGVLAGGIAHDFNNLLTAIQGHAELALRRITPEHPVFDNLKRIEATVHRAGDLARQMLSYSGRAKFTAKPLDLNGVVRDMAELLKVSIPKKVQLATSLQADLPLVVGDETQIQQVLMNLVTNGAEAIGERPGTVEVRTSLVSLGTGDLEGLALKDGMTPGRFLCMEVQDDGCGIPHDTLPRIFDPFYSTKFTGRGLGLSAVAGILQGHRGGLGVESQEGRPTVFRVYLPASELPRETGEEVAPPAVEPVIGTVLVVDDEGIVRDLAVMALKPMGYEVLTAQDGQEAVEVYQSRPGRISVVLMDMTMPRMDGLEAFRLIRQMDPRARVILSSGYSEQEAYSTARELNPEGFLQKPYRIQELLQKIHEAVTRDEP